MPHSDISTPSYSSCSLTRIPMTAFKMPQTIRLVPKTQTNIVAAPISWPLNDEPSLVNGTSSSPNRPTTPCTEMAPTGSSIFSLSNVIMANTTNTPPRPPNNVACKAVGVDGSAVMATSPANAPLSAIVRSALPNITLAKTMAAIRPPAAAALVFMKTTATALALSTLAVASTEPPLKPNQPIHRTKVPNVAIGILAPGIGLIEPSAPYLPFRAPSRSTPARAADAPAMCTMPDPAKSEKPRSPSVYMPKTDCPPQVQEPSIG